MFENINNNIQCDAEAHFESDAKIDKELNVSNPQEIDEEINMQNKQQIVTKSKPSLPMSFAPNIAEYVKKSIEGHLKSGSFLIPYIHLMHQKNNKSSILSVMPNIQNRGGETSTIISFPDKVKVGYMDDKGLDKIYDNNVITPEKKIKHMYHYECALALEKYTTNDSELVNWRETINNIVENRFAALENEILINDSEMQDKIDTLGNLKRYKCKVLDVEIDEKDPTTLIKLHDAIMDLTNEIKFSTNQPNITLCTSPMIMGLLNKTRDANNNLLSYNQFFPQQQFCHSQFDKVQNQIIIADLSEYLVMKPTNLDVVKDEHSNRAFVKYYIRNGLCASILNYSAFGGIHITFK